MPLGIWPAQGRKTSEFWEDRGSYFHKGVDIANSASTPIIATATGRVVRVAYESGGYGNYIIIGHGDTRNSSSVYYTIYGHLLEKSRWAVGEVVTKGQQIGYMGNTGNSRGNHVHYEIRDINKNPINPEIQ